MRQGARAGRAVVAGLISATVAVGLVVLAGCSGSDPAPIDAPTGHPGTAPPTTTASATPTQDPGPAAIAAVQRMFDAYNAMLKSGSSTAYRATFTKTCALCLGDAQTIDAIARKHERIVGGQYSTDRAPGRFRGSEACDRARQRRSGCVRRCFAGQKVVARYDAGKPGPVRLGRQAHRRRLAGHERAVAQLKRSESPRLLVLAALVGAQSIVALSPAEAGSCSRPVSWDLRGPRLHVRGAGVEVRPGLEDVQ